MIEFDVSIVARNGDPILLRNGESIDGRIRPDRRQWSPHVFQIPDADGPVVGTGHHFVRTGEHRRRHGLGVTLNEKWKRFHEQTRKNVLHVMHNTTERIASFLANNPAPMELTSSLS